MNTYTCKIRVNADFDNTYFALLWEASSAEHLRSPTGVFSNYLEVKHPIGMHTKMQILGLFRYCRKTDLSTIFVLLSCSGFCCSTCFVSLSAMKRTESLILLKIIAMFCID